MCLNFHHPLLNTFAINFQLLFPLKQLAQPLVHHYKNIVIQLCYDYNTTIYNFIKIHVH